MLIVKLKVEPESFVFGIHTDDKGRLSLPDYTCTHTLRQEQEPAGRWKGMKCRSEKEDKQLPLKLVN